MLLSEMLELPQVPCFPSNKMSKTESSCSHLNRESASVLAAH